jgi:hypothetical protein
MSIHPLVVQLRFARSEFLRGLEGLSPEDASQRFLPMNCISWMVGHLANQETRYWVRLAQGQELYPELNDLVGYRRPASTPPLGDMLAAWYAITAAADCYLETVTPAVLENYFVWKEKRIDESIGTLLQRNIYHYWYHTGESQAVRQMLGHDNLAEYVGEMSEAVYRPE